MKGVILGIAPGATIVDLTHEVPPQDVAAGAYLLRSAIGPFPRGTIHVAVVDPGVGTSRRAIVVETADAFFVGPDNGLFAAVVSARAVRRIIDVSRSLYRRPAVSQTFHGRDVFAPVAAHLASGVPLAHLGRAVKTMRRGAAARPRRRGRTLRGKVIWIDHFGNLISDVTIGDLAGLGRDFRTRSLSVTIADRTVRLRRSYAGVPPGAVLAIVNSADTLEIAINRGSAAAVLGCARGDPVTVTAG
jgi:S-adenosylmethionine hydrolase